MEEYLSFVTAPSGCHYIGIMFRGLGLRVQGDSRFMRRTENEMETTIVCWDYIIGRMKKWKLLVYWGYIGRMENKMETIDLVVIPKP